MVLRGTEVKSLRENGAQLKDGFAMIRDGEIWLQNVHIPPYGPAARDNHEPERPRKLLAHRREIERLMGRTVERGLTLVPTRLYFSDGKAKVEIALAKGKDRFDKRESLKKKDMQRDMQRALRDAGR
jgi:SsrA-binding protein